MTPELIQFIEAYEAEERRLKEQSMGRYATDAGSGDFKQAPAGNHVARCIKLIDLGTQHGEYKGEPTVRNQIVMQWELPHETMEIDGQQKPLIVSKFYTNSLNEKSNLRADLEAWRGRPFTIEELRKFDLEAVLGKPCMVNVVHNDKGRAKVTSVAAMAKGMTCPEAFNKPMSFWIDPWNDAAYMELPEGFRKIIAQSDEFKGLNDPGHGVDERHPPADDDIPF